MYEDFDFLSDKSYQDLFREILFTKNCAKCGIEEKDLRPWPSTEEFVFATKGYCGTCRIRFAVEGVK